MPPSELRARYREFLRLIPERISILEAAVRTAVDDAWAADMTSRSLGSLSVWLQKSTTMRRRSAAEMAELRRTSKLPFEIPEADLSEQTLSCVYDVAMYCASALLNHHPQLQWSVDFHSKLDVNYGQPVLIGLSKGVPINPVRIVFTIAYSIVRGTATSDELTQVFQRWNERVSPGSRVHWRRNCD